MAQCHECDAIKEYQGNQSQRDYTFEFEYYETSEISVSVYNSTTGQWEKTDAWHLANPTTVRLDNPTKEKIRIYRCTDLEPMRSVFQPGSSIKARDLNDNFDQLRNAVEEAKCAAEFADNRFDELDDIYLNRIEAGESKDGTEGDLVKSHSELLIDDEHVATTKWIDNRYWDQCEETTYKDDKWVDEIDDAHVPTTGAVEQRLTDFSGVSGVKKVTGDMQRSQKWDDSVTDDDHVATTDALVERLDVYFSDSNTKYPIDRWTQPGKLWIKGDKAELFYRRADGDEWVQIDNRGVDGKSCTVDVGTTTTGDPGTDALVENSGTTTNAIFDFTIPRGEPGKDGGFVSDIGDTPPTSPINGQTWFNTKVGRMFIYYTDGNSSQWVQS